MSDSVQRQVVIAMNGDREKMDPGTVRSINVLATAVDETRDSISGMESRLIDQIEANGARTDRRLKSVTTLLTAIATLLAGGLITLVTALLT